MLSGVKEVSIDHVQSEAAAILRDGYRFVTMTCVDLGEAHDILYHFDKNYVMCHLRVALKRGEHLPSISGVCFAATIVENEMKDLFGLEIDGLAIDYQGRFMLSEDAPKAPLNKSVGIGVDIRVKQPESPKEGGQA